MSDSTKQFEYNMKQKMICTKCKGFKSKDIKSTEWKINCPYYFKLSYQKCQENESYNVDLKS